MGGLGGLGGSTDDACLGRQDENDWEIGRQTHRPTNPPSPLPEFLLDRPPSMVYSCVTAASWAQVFWRFQMDSKNARGVLRNGQDHVVFGFLAGVVMLAGPFSSLGQNRE